MVHPRRNTAVLLAGGVGARLGLGIPKQLAKLAGRTILEHSLAAFHSHSEVDEIVVMMAPGHLDAVHTIVRDGGYTKVVGVYEGGRTRSDTTVRALATMDERDRKVLLHDAARPLVTQAIISDCLRTLDEYDAVSVAIPSTDTVVEVTSDGLVRAAPPREALHRVQTPQGFRLSVIREAHERARLDPAFQATDDATVVLRYLPRVPIVVVPGDERNLKVTSPLDLRLAERLLRSSAVRTARAASSSPTRS